MAAPPPAAVPRRFPGDNPASVPHILRRSATILPSPALLAAAVLLLSFRSALLAVTVSLSTAADRDPSLRLFFNRLSSSPPPFPQHRRRVPVLSPDPHHLHHFSGGRGSTAAATAANASAFPFLFLGPVPKTLPRLPNPAPKIRPASAPVFFLVAGGDEHAERRPILRGLDIDRREAGALIYLLSLLSSAHSVAVLGFVAAYSSCFGIVFLYLALSCLSRRSSLADTLHSGARLGLLRLTGFVFLRWSARDALVQLLCILFLSDIPDQGRLFKLFVMVKFLPFSLVASPHSRFWMGAWGEEITEFMMAWTLLDTVMSMAFTFVPWVMVLDRDARRRGRDVIREGLFLVTLVPTQALQIKWLEMVACGSVVRAVLTAVGGRMFAMAVQTIAEVYFIAAWLLLYFGARSKEEDLEGRRFGLQDLEDGINVDR